MRTRRERKRLLSLLVFSRPQPFTPFCQVGEGAPPAFLAPLPISFPWPLFQLHSAHLLLAHGGAGGAFLGPGGGGESRLGAGQSWGRAGGPTLFCPPRVRESIRKPRCIKASCARPRQNLPFQVLREDALSSGAQNGGHNGPGGAEERKREWGGVMPLPPASRAPHLQSAMGLWLCLSSRKARPPPPPLPTVQLFSLSLQCLSWTIAAGQGGL